MPIKLGRLKPGDKIEMTCYKPGCENVSITVTLGKEIESLPWLSLSAGRLRWSKGAAYQAFELWEEFGGSGHCNCPQCKTLFDHVVAIFPLEGEPIIYGYDPEPA